MIFDLGFLEKIIIIEKERSHNKWTWSQIAKPSKGGNYFPSLGTRIIKYCFCEAPFLEGELIKLDHTYSSSANVII
jgi:hypothetical protein